MVDIWSIGEVRGSINLHVQEKEDNTRHIAHLLGGILTPLKIRSGAEKGLLKAEKRISPNQAYNFFHQSKKYTVLIDGRKQGTIHIKRDDLPLRTMTKAERYNYDSNKLRFSSYFINFHGALLEEWKNDIFEGFARKARKRR